MYNSIIQKRLLALFLIIFVGAISTLGDIESHVATVTVNGCAFRGLENCLYLEHKYHDKKTYYAIHGNVALPEPGQAVKAHGQVNGNPNICNLKRTIVIDFWEPIAPTCSK